MKLSVSAYRAHATAHKKILSSGFHSQYNYGSTGAASTSTSSGLYRMGDDESRYPPNMGVEYNSDPTSPTGTHGSEHAQGDPASKNHNVRRGDPADCKSPSQRNEEGISDADSDWNRSNQRWMKLRTTVQISSAIQKKPPLKREDSFLKRFSTRQTPEAQETVEDSGSESASGDADKVVKRRRRYLKKRRSVVNPDENFYFYWLMMLTICILYNLWTLIVRQSFPELQKAVPTFWFSCDILTDIVFICDIIVQLRTGYLEQGLMVYDDKKLALHYMHSRDFFFDIISLIPLDLLQLKMGVQPLLRFTRFFKVYRSVKFYYIVESRTVWPNLWRVVNLIHILLILAHWFGCFYYLLSEAEGFQGDWVYPYRPGDYATLTRKYLGSLYWSTLTLTTIGDLPTPETNAEPNFSVDGPRSIPRRGIKSRLLQFGSSYGYVFTIVSYLIGVFIFATIVGQVGNVITNRNANRLEFERLLDGAKTYMRHHKVPGGMKRRVLRWYDYSWSRGRIQGGGDINTALGLLPDKLKTELALHVNLSVLKKVTIFQECQPEFLHDLVLKMKAYIFTPGDSICRKGEVAREMFIIADGILEVLSETGKVLTTMKAGDFFGEIGILNLDGLNKRTADVRSVGYSELFSLSREDVLAAMKDYPDAQEILQTLGRKRLMEVRCVNKKHAKAQHEKEIAVMQNQHPHNSQSDNGENSASKKIIDKFRSDVKGFKSALKKTRTSRRSNESLEMQPLHNTSPKSGKSMLKRMSRVKSDEKEETADFEDAHEKAPSTIGAGLPLLQRLRLLKEKQDREERTIKSIPPLKSPPHPHVTCTLSPQESIQEEPETETKEGSPLLQQVHPTKVRNEIVSNDTNIMKDIPPMQLTKMESSAVGSSNNNNHSANISSLTVAQIKPIMKVSFKQRMQQLQITNLNNASQHNPEEVVLKKSVPKTLPLIPHEHLDPMYPTISKPLKRPSIKTPSSISEVDTPIKPWSKLKLATVISSSYTSLSNCSPDYTETKVNNSSMLNISTALRKDTQKESISSHPRRASITMPSSNAKKLPATNSLDTKSKFYKTVFDLSPEYSGLPFVKRLKILNERQKLSELETVLRTSSFSLDSTKNNDDVPLSDSLYRCFSDTSGIYSQFVSTHESSSTTSTNTSTSEGSQKLHTVQDDWQHHYSPLSSESNENLGHRKLKSIIKKLQISKDDDDFSSSQLEFKPFEVLNARPTSQGPSIAHWREITDETKNSNQSDNIAPHTSIQKHKSCSYFSKVKKSAYEQSENLFHEKTSSTQTVDINTKKEQIDNIEGLFSSRDYFNHMLFGMNNAIRSHMNEIHTKFESQFAVMEHEVKKRDAIIANLQMKLRHLEFKPISVGYNANREDHAPFSDDEGLKSDGNSSSGSSGELLFMRGDSLDTVFTSSPPVQVDRSPGSSRMYHSKKYLKNMSSTSKVNERKSSLKHQKSHDVLVSNTSGNLQLIPDSVILDINESSSSSLSSSKSNLVIADDCDETMQPVNHNNWEVTMLAAELERQERRRGNSLCDNPNDYKFCNTILRRRRKLSDSDTEQSELEASSVKPRRVRSSSLDQYNPTHGIGSEIFKVMSIDHDKDKL